jgi:pimeloyl-ACP methyl ester carboxylesterase
MKHRYLDLSENRVHYLESGKGRYLIILPSFGLTSKSYSLVGDLLGKKYHVIIPDLYKGLSNFKKNASTFEDYVNSLNCFADKLRIKNFFLIGISFSGVIAFKYSQKYPSILNKLMLVSTTIVPFRSSLFWLFWSYTKLVFNNLFSLRGISANYMWFSDGIVNLIRHPKQVLQDSLMATKIYDAKFKKVSVKTKLLFSKNDEFLSNNLVKEMPHIKNLKIKIIGEGHAWFFIDKNKLVNEIVEFFK